MMLLNKIRSARGSGMIITLFVMMLLFALGMSFLSVASSSIITSKRDTLRARALTVAEAGVDQAMAYLMTTGPGGEPSGTWRTTHVHSASNPDSHSACSRHIVNLSATEKFSLCVRDGSGPTAGKIVIASTGTVTSGSSTVSRTVKVIVKFSKENVNVWNNVIFGGVGQSGRSINGNVVMRGSVHLLGDGEEFTDVDNDGHWDDNEAYTDLPPKNGNYDFGEPFIDVDGDGHRDAREPFNDVNGNGTRDPALTVTDIAEEISGTADVGNNYSGMPAGLRSLIPDPPQTEYGGQVVDTLNAKLRVKNGRVNISGSATVGWANNTSNTYKETMDGCYVSDGYGGNKGASSVYSDNGYNNGYDLGEGLVKMPVVSDPYDGYPSYMDYLAANANVVTPAGGTLTITSGNAYSVSNAKGSLTIDANGNMNVSGIVYINGDLSLGSKGKPIRYSGSGTIVATGNIYIHGDVLPKTKFPTVDALGLIARRHAGIATGGGDSQLTMALAVYAQENVTIGKQCEIAGTVVTSYFAMNNVPHIYQVPELSNHLPPGMPGADPIWIKNISVESWQETKS
jgi:hypothetical protein